MSYVQPNTKLNIVLFMLVLLLMEDQYVIDVGKLLIKNNGIFIQKNAPVHK